ncbi:MAG: hypothetical protein QXG00_01905 [Candidatus Woesearchaeota archaeon]
MIDFVVMFSSPLMLIWDVFKHWINLFIAPVLDFNMLWIIVPVYLNWIVTEIFQEKKGTSFGNAITNGVVMLWVGVDWTRQIIYQGILEYGWGILFIKSFIALLAFIYGIIIIVVGLRAKKITKYIGRIREISYFCIVFTPIFYGVINPELKVFIAIILFFPVFYFFFELLDFIIPDPKTNKIDENEDIGVSYKNKDIYQNSSNSFYDRSVDMNNLRRENTFQPFSQQQNIQSIQDTSIKPFNFSYSAQAQTSNKKFIPIQKTRRKYYSYPYSKNYNPDYNPFIKKS